MDGRREADQVEQREGIGAIHAAYRRSYQQGDLGVEPVDGCPAREEISYLHRAIGAP